jgi:hypothetical protein
MGLATCQVPSKLDFYNLVQDLLPGFDFTWSMLVTAGMHYSRCFKHFVATDIPTQQSVGIQFAAVGTQQFPCIRCRGSMRSNCSRCAAMDFI